MKTYIIYQVVSCLSHKIKIPVKRIPAAEILAVAESIDEGKTFSQAHSELIGTDIKQKLCLDSKDLLS